MSAQVNISPGELARPLKVLVPLIKQDIEAARNAGMPYYRAAGEKLIEAKSQLAHGEWQEWLKRNFSLTARTAQNYMQMADAQNRNMFRFSSLREFLRQKAECAGGARGAQLVANITENRKEGQLMRKMEIAIINAGFKVLANKHHPDKGGNGEEMTRLNKARESVIAALKKREVR